MHATARTKPIAITLAIKGDTSLPEPDKDALGTITLGPNGLLHLLETQLGEPTATHSFTSRLIQYLSCIDQVSHPNAFYYESYQADPFSVAKTLLQWRDQWYLAGWTGGSVTDGPRRICDMAAIEKLASGTVSAGLGQRIQRVISLMQSNKIQISRISLRDALVDFAYGWQQLIKSIDAPTEELTEVIPQAREGTDLYRLQQRLLHSSEQKVSLKGDGSVIALRADSPYESAPLTAILAYSRQHATPPAAVALLAEARGAVLDDTLELQRRPRLGFSAVSPWRPILQVLPLACDLLWEPLNATALLQFLSHPVAPIPVAIRKKLARTVANTPGVGSPAWEDAIAQSLRHEEPDTSKKIERDIRYWLESPRFSAQDGIDSQSLSDRAQRVQLWLVDIRLSKEDPAWKALCDIALNQIREFIQAIERLQGHGRNTLSQDNVRRLIDDVRGIGAAVTDRNAEVSPGLPRVRRADHTGGFHCSSGAATEHVIWWDCQATDLITRWPWSQSERQALGGLGVHLQTEEQQLQWLGKAWLRPVFAARESCVFVLHDDTERHHPTWDQIASVSDGLPILQATSSDTAERLGIAYQTGTLRPLPIKKRWWRLPDNTIIPTRHTESFSSLNTYLYSPYQWLLRYSAKIQAGPLLCVSDGMQLKGNLAHRLYERFFEAHPHIERINAGVSARWIDAQMLFLLRQEGATLLAAGRTAERESFTAQLQFSLVTLIEHLQSANVVRVQMELHQESDYTGGKLNGFIDMLATRNDGCEAVVDIKWGGKQYRRSALQKNDFLQLATYAKLRRSNGAKISPALSYFIVNDSHMLSLNHSFFPDAEIIEPQDSISSSAFWQRCESSWHWRKSQFDQGMIEITVTGTEPTNASIPEENCLDIPAASDTFNEFSVLTGWCPDQ